MFTTPILKVLLIQRLQTYLWSLKHNWASVMNHFFVHLGSALFQHTVGGQTTLSARGELPD